MLGCNVSGYSRTCTPVTGGVSDLLVGDANDFDFTSGAPGTNGEPVGYDTIALHSGSGSGTSGGAYLYGIESLSETIGIDITQANADGSSSSYEYIISARLAQMSQTMTNFNYKLDAAAVCCQLVFVWRSNDGHIFVAGEKYVDGDSIVPFRLRNDGSKVSSGKKFTEFNGEDLSLKGSYNRLPYEYTGTWSSIEALMAP
jgi:hypothetical protein